MKRCKGSRVAFASEAAIRLTEHERRTILDANESYEKIREQILLLNPTAEEKTIRKFIEGR